MPNFNPHFRDSREAFENAIRLGRLSDSPASPENAGRFMYMHSEHDGTGLTLDAFKNIETREYIRVPHPHRLDSIPEPMKRAIHKSRAFSFNR